MSYDKTTRSINRFNARRIIRNQTEIYLLYNEVHQLDFQKPNSFAKRKSMNCSCPMCRAWDRIGRQNRFNYELEKSGMKDYLNDVTDLTQEEEWV